MGDRLATIDMGRKAGAAVPLSVEAAGSPSNTIWRGLRPTAVPSGILIRPTVRPQYTDVTDRIGQTTVRWHMANRFTDGRPIKQGSAVADKPRAMRCSTVKRVVAAQCDKLATELSWQHFASTVANCQFGWLEFSVPLQHKYGYIRDDANCQLYLSCI